MDGSKLTMLFNKAIVDTPLYWPTDIRAFTKEVIDPALAQAIKEYNQDLYEENKQIDKKNDEFFQAVKTPKDTIREYYDATQSLQHESRIQAIERQLRIGQSGDTVGRVPIVANFEQRIYAIEKLNLDDRIQQLEKRLGELEKAIHIVDPASMDSRIGHIEGHLGLQWERSEECKPIVMRHEDRLGNLESDVKELYSRNEKKIDQPGCGTRPAKDDFIPGSTAPLKMGTTYYVDFNNSGLPQGFQVTSIPNQKSIMLQSHQPVENVKFHTITIYRQ